MSVPGSLLGLIGTIVSEHSTLGFTWPIYILSALIISINNISKTGIRQTRTIIFLIIILS